jgi:hypothetical protein
MHITWPSYGGNLANGRRAPRNRARSGIQNKCCIVRFSGLIGLNQGIFHYHPGMIWILNRSKITFRGSGLEPGVPFDPDGGGQENNRDRSHHRKGNNADIHAPTRAGHMPKLDLRNRKRIAPAQGARVGNSVFGWNVRVKKTFLHCAGSFSIRLLTMRADDF